MQSQSMLLDELMKPDPEVYLLTLQCGLAEHQGIWYRDVQFHLYRETPVEIPVNLVEWLTVDLDESPDDCVHSNSLERAARAMGRQLFTRTATDAIEDWAQTIADEEYKDWGVLAEDTLYRSRQVFPISRWQECISDSPIDRSCGFPALTVEEQIAGSRIRAFYTVIGCEIDGRPGRRVDASDFCLEIFPGTGVAIQRWPDRDVLLSPRRDE